MSVVTLNPVAGANFPVDGATNRNGVNQTFSAIRAGAGVFASATQTDLELSLASSGTTDQFDTLYRSFLVFDTSSIPSGSSISSAILSLYGTSKTNNLGSPDLHIGGANLTGNANIVTGDYLHALTTSFGSVAYASISTVAYNDITLNASGIAAINMGAAAWSQFSIQLSWDINASFTGTWSGSKSSVITVGAADNASSTKWPKLVITYTTPSGPANVKTWDGITQSTGVKTYGAVALGSTKTWDGIV